MVKQTEKLSFIPEEEKDILGISDKRERASTLFAKKGGDLTTLDDFEVK